MLIKFNQFSLKFVRLRSTLQSMKIVEKKVKVGKNHINYAITELNKDPAEKTLLMLPGALGSALTDFKPQLESLPSLLPNYQIIAWDPPGYGKSIPPERQFPLNFLENDADVAHELMSVLNVQKYSILGWSDGGITGLILAGKYPQNIEKLAIFGSNAFIVEEELEIYKNIRDVSKWSARMREPLEQLYGAGYFKKTWENWVDAFVAIYKQKGGDLCTEFVKKVTAETLILHGEKDPMLSKVHVPYLMKELKSTRLITWPDGKHNIHLKYADDFNRNLATFLLKN
jgi:valacyclovir hydrolase